MKKKFICILPMFILTFVLSACRGGQDDNAEKLKNDVETIQFEDIIPANNIDNNTTEPEDVIGNSNTTESEDAIGDSSTAESDDANEDAVKSQDSGKENNTVKSDTDKKVNAAISSENNADKSSTKSNDSGQQSVTTGILDSSASFQSGSGGLGANDESSKNSGSQTSESKNETVLYQKED